MEKLQAGKIILVGILLISAFYFGKISGGGDQNSTLIYGDTGFPKNCRAIIDANLRGWKAGDYTIEGALDSIERNCGAHGYSWGR